MNAYEASYKEGTYVQIADRSTLEQFLATWHLHNPLRPEQLEFAARVAKVRWIGYYHGGYVLYQLEGVPGIWHEQCLSPPAST